MVIDSDTVKKCQENESQRLYRPSHFLNYIQLLVKYF